MNRNVSRYFVPIVSGVLFNFLCKVTSCTRGGAFPKSHFRHARTNRANTYIPDVTMEIPEVQQHGYRSNLQDDG